MIASHPRRLTDDEHGVVKSFRAATQSCLGIVLRDVQVTAATHLLAPCIAEMATGEGKTLTAALSASLFASDQRNVLIATANDYLARRDHDWMSQVFEKLGLRCGYVTSESTPRQRAAAYQCQITYATLREFAFDYLRKSLAHRARGTQSSVQWSADVLLVDEADSILIDEARTPLIITAPCAATPPSDPHAAAREECYRWSAAHAEHARIAHDYVRIAESGAVALTSVGHQRVLHSEMPAAMSTLTTTEILHAVERAIWVNESIRRDVHYIIRDQRVHIIDEFTGRKSGERSFSGGIHQAIEAREGLPLSPESEQIAKISVQDYVTKFQHLCGITATARENQQELRRMYGLSVRTIHTHQPSRRTMLDTIVCRSRDDKWQRIAEETRDVLRQNRSVLIGTRSVSQSEQLSNLFRSRGIEHSVLNAKRPRQEASVIAEAGRANHVTIATNMAGRGTDIRLEPCVASSGGLHVIVSEPHASGRIDRQLIGRCGRQGDPGTARIFLSPDDEILAQAFGEAQAAQIGKQFNEGASDRWLQRKIAGAQRRVANLHRRERARLTALEATNALALQQLGLDAHLSPISEIS